MNTKHLIITALSAVLPLTAAAAVVTYPAGEGVPVVDTYTVSVRQGDGSWLPVDVYPVRVDKVTDGVKHTAAEVAMAYFDFDGGPVEVKVTSNAPAAVKTARVRPLSKGIVPKTDGKTLTFTLRQPENLSVEVNGDIFGNLHLFANPVDTERPTARQIGRAGKDRLIYFGPGVHQLDGDTMRIESGSKVYIAGGARVYGTLIADGVHGVRFCGRGEVHPGGRGAGIEIRRSRDIEVEGVIVSQVPVGGSDSVRISNVKAISWYGWGDGMNVFASSNVSYDRVFCRNSDDCSTVYATRKGFRGGCNNIKMENSTLWADTAHPIFIGLHGAATEIGVDAPSDTIENVLYRNIDIIDQRESQKDYQGCMAINCGDNNVVRNINFEEIRVDDIRCGQLVNIRISQNQKYCKAPGRSVSGVHFKDIMYRGDKASTSMIIGYSPERRITDVTFENLYVNGLRISDDMPQKPRWFKTSDMCDMYIGEHVDNVVFK